MKVVIHNRVAIEKFRYTWGLDVSGTLEGAGGVGGLLAIERNVNNNYSWDIRYPHYDANGNIMALSNSSGQISARYRYDAFGKTILSTDVDGSGWNTKNIHGFSTKPTLGNHKLHYYGYRWYDASNGRWINRDPIEEEGGVNLYGFVGNDGVGVIDYLGNNAFCAPAAGGVTAAGVALAFGLTVTECMQDPACSEAVNKLNDPTICFVAIWGATIVVQEGVKKGACCCIDKVNGLLRWGARSAKQAACMASCNAAFLAVDKVCDSLPGKYRTKCHADALKDLKDCLATCK